VRCGLNQDREAGGWSTPWRGDGGIWPNSDKSSNTPTTYCRQGVEGWVEVTLALILVEENTLQRKDDGGSQVPPFIEVDNIEKNGPRGRGSINSHMKGDPNRQ
jgi:hypothetical protein